MLDNTSALLAGCGAKIKEFLARFAEAGLWIGISEFDVRTASAGGTEEDRLRLSA